MLKLFKSALYSAYYFFNVYRKAVIVRNGMHFVTDAMLWQVIKNDVHNYFAFFTAKKNRTSEK
ncbi:hypothetical protein UA36_04070 [Photobacterium angustum]|nr:hypothetical protein UA39_20920 [Photobacterium angustum]KJG34153.1 hypothetical protein UA36_04070 [Photobacterium angustum]